MIYITDKSHCCGCTACASVCHHNAITMEPDELGFLYPQVNLANCVECGLCDKVCQFNVNYSRYDNFEPPIAYSFRLNDDKQLMQSQSGGAFYAIADSFIELGGIVYGASFSDYWKVAHRRVVNQEELDSIRKTKYVQSDIRGVFSLIKKDLKEGKRVLFSGTSCQVAGLKSFIPNLFHENLICIDIICHGVSSPKIWDDYLLYLTDRYKSEIVRACFRDKRFGWHGARESFLLKNGKEIFRRSSNYLYFQGYSVRPSCATCVFTNTKRVGDITVGDLWGLPKDSPYEIDAKGVSLVLVNSNVGKRLFERINSVHDINIIDINDFLQPQLQYPCKLNSRQKAFINDYHNRGFVYVAKRYGDMGWRYKYTKFKEIIKKIMYR